MAEQNNKPIEVIVSKEDNLKGRKKRILIFALVGLFFFFVILGSSLSEPSPQPSSTLPQSQEQQDQGKAVAYEIVESEDISVTALGGKPLSEYTPQQLKELPTAKRVKYRVVVSPEIKKNQVRPTVEKIISELTSQDVEIDGIALFLYSDKELVNGGYDVALATWAPGGKVGNITPETAQSNSRAGYSISLTVKDNLEEYLQQRGQSEEKFGFTEAERRQIFKELVAAEDRAQAEADAMYPIDIFDPNYKQENVTKNIDKYGELVEKYKAQVRARYGMTEDIENKIVVEAFEESWPFE